MFNKYYFNMAKYNLKINKKGNIKPKPFKYEDKNNHFVIWFAIGLIVAIIIGVLL